ncbi:MAG: DNA replication protein DnaC, partial [Terriglobia bacterium]
LNQRYSHKRTTLLTTNYLDAPEPSATPRRERPGRGHVMREEQLAERIGYRMRSRLYEMCRVVEIQADDFRRRVKQARYRFAD